MQRKHQILQSVLGIYKMTTMTSGYMVSDGRRELNDTQVSPSSIRIKTSS